MFKLNDIVKTAFGVCPVQKTGGVVLYLACFLATTVGGKICSKKTCTHTSTHVWVKWQDDKIYTYTLKEIEIDDTKSNPAPVDVKEKDIKPILKISPKEKLFDWDFYTGYTTVKYGRDGKAHLIRNGVSIVDEKLIPPIELKELDWDQYNIFSGKPCKKI